MLNQHELIPIHHSLKQNVYTANTAGRDAKLKLVLRLHVGLHQPLDKPLGPPSHIIRSHWRHWAIRIEIRNHLGPEDPGGRDHIGNEGPNVVAGGRGSGHAPLVDPFIRWEETDETKGTRVGPLTITLGEGL